jgi:hypothetical protein
VVGSIEVDRASKCDPRCRIGEGPAADVLENVKAMSRDTSRLQWAKERMKAEEEPVTADRLSFSLIVGQLDN